MNTFQIFKSQSYKCMFKESDRDIILILYTPLSCEVLKCHEFYGNNRNISF